FLDPPLHQQHPPLVCLGVAGVVVATSHEAAAIRQRRFEDGHARQRRRVGDVALAANQLGDVVLVAVGEGDFLHDPLREQLQGAKALAVFHLLSLSNWRTNSDSTRVDTGPSMSTATSSKTCATDGP